MALKKSELNESIIAIMQDMMSRKETSIEEFAKRLTDAIDVYIKTAEIIYETGLTSATGGVVTGSFQGKLK